MKITAQRYTPQEYNHGMADNRPIETETTGDYLRRLIDASGKSIAKVAREADTSPAVLDSVLTGRRNLGPDLAIRLAKSLGVDLIEFFIGARILPHETTNQRSALEFTLLGIFDGMPTTQKNQLISIAKALADDPPA